MLDLPARLAGLAIGASAAVLLTIGSARAQIYQIDGFTVQEVPSPATASIPVAADLSGPLYYAITSAAGVGSSPYTGALAEKAPFLSLFKQGKAFFNFSEDATTLYIQWGSIGVGDTVFFDAKSAHGSTQIGFLSGQDLGAVYGNGTSHYLAITSGTPFRRVLLSEETTNEGGSCCFEFADLSVR